MRHWWLLALLVLALFALNAYRAHRVTVRMASETETMPSESDLPGIEPLPLTEARTEDSDEGRRYYVRNLIAGPVELEVSLEKADNMNSDPVLPQRFLLAAKAERQVVAIRRINPAQQASATLRYRSMLGNPRAEHAADARYEIPFYQNTHFSISQKYNGSFSHHDRESRYAVDFGVPIGTPVIAARAGTVMQVEEEFRGHGLALERYGNRANYVRVLHADGSMAVYAHLEPQSTIVTPGQRVTVGALLGKSGNTGYTTGPHLHFAVQVNVGMELQAVPFSMAGVTDDPLATSSGLLAD